MHILIAVLHRPVAPTGVCRYAANLAQCLAQDSTVERVTLVTGSWQKDYFKTAFLINSNKIDLVGVDIPNNSLSRNLWFLFGFPKLVQDFSPDLVHLSFPLPFLRSQFACPVVSTIHDLYPYECPENFGYVQAFFNRLFLKQCVQYSDGISCVSAVTQERLNHFFPKAGLQKPISVIYNYVDFENVEPKAPKHIQAANDYPFLLCVAQHRKNKNLDLLISAFSLLLKNRQIQDLTKLIIVGSSGPETQALQHQVQEVGLQDQVIFRSDVEDTELYWLYQNAELFVIPSSTEGFCLPLVEALYASSKVVCSNIPILREIGSSLCTYFDLGSEATENLAQAIVHTLQQPDRTAARDPRFSKINAAKQYLEFYSKFYGTYVWLHQH